MRKTILYFNILLFFLVLTSCTKTDKNIKIEYSESDMFSKEEIESAANCVMEYFEGFTSAAMTKLWYDDESSNKAVSSYMQGGRGSANGVLSENVIVLFSNFDVDGSGEIPSLNPNSTYTDWMWIIIRDSSTSSWKIDDMGY